MIPDGVSGSFAISAAGLFERHGENNSTLPSADDVGKPAPFTTTVADGPKTSLPNSVVLSNGMKGATEMTGNVSIPTAAPVAEIVERVRELSRTQQPSTPVESTKHVKEDPDDPLYDVQTGAEPGQV
jgi:hypothetical protein